MKVPIFLIVSLLNSPQVIHKLLLSLPPSLRWPGTAAHWLWTHAIVSYLLVAFLLLTYQDTMAVWGVSPIC